MRICQSRGKSLASPKEKAVAGDSRVDESGWEMVRSQREKNLHNLIGLEFVLPILEYEWKEA
jgi:hypothetical protein